MLSSYTSIEMAMVYAPLEGKNNVSGLIVRAQYSMETQMTRI